MVQQTPGSRCFMVANNGFISFRLYELLRQILPVCSNHRSGRKMEWRGKEFVAVAVIVVAHSFIRVCLLSCQCKTGFVAPPPAQSLFSQECNLFVVLHLPQCERMVVASLATASTDNRVSTSNQEQQQQQQHQSIRFAIFCNSDWLGEGGCRTKTKIVDVVQNGCTCLGTWSLIHTACYIHPNRLSSCWFVFFACGCCTTKLWVVLFLASCNMLLHAHPTRACIHTHTYIHAWVTVIRLSLWRAPCEYFLGLAKVVTVSILRCWSPLALFVFPF